MNIKGRFLIVIGFLFLILGIVGLFFPILPTTPLVLLASGCFTSSPRLSSWLKKNQLFGDYITNYKERKGLKKITVIKSLSFLWIMLILSTIVIHSLWSTIVLPSIGVAVTIHVLWMARPKTLKAAKEHLL